MAEAAAGPPQAAPANAGRANAGQTNAGQQALPLEGPPQAGQGNNGQYVYWIVMTNPTDEHVAAHGVRRPSDFDRDRPPARVPGKNHTFGHSQGSVDA